jgi:hypothetical protein
MLSTLALLSLSPLLQQQGNVEPPVAEPPAAATVPADLAALAARVEKAHRPDGPVPPVTAFTAMLELRVLDKRAEQRGQVELDVRYLEWTPPSGKKAQTLIRYEIRDASTPIVRGSDEYGPWQLVQGEPRDLTGADAAEDRDQFERHRNLARQLVRFLSPGDVLRSLGTPTAVIEDDLPVERGLVVPCATVTGTLPSFPLLQHGGDDAPARVTLWIDKASGRLLAVDAAPLRDGEADLARGERILLLELQCRDGLLVPTHLKHLFRREDRKLAPWSEVQLTKLSLRPPLGRDDFDRTRKD